MENIDKNNNEDNGLKDFQNDSKPENVINLNNITNNTKIEDYLVNIDNSLVKDIKSINQTHYVDNHGYIKEKILYRIKKYTCRFFIGSGFLATLFYGVALPYFESNNREDNRKLAFEKTNHISKMIFNYDLSNNGEIVETENIKDDGATVKQIPTNNVKQDKDVLINEIKKEIKNDNIIKTIKITDDEPITNLESKKVVDKNKNMSVVNEEIKKPELIKKPDLVKTPVIEKTSEVIDESSDFNKNKESDTTLQNDTQGIEKTSSSEEKTLNEEKQPLFNDNKKSVKKLMEETKINSEITNENINEEEITLPSREEILKDNE